MLQDTFDGRILRRNERKFINDQHQTLPTFRFSGNIGHRLLPVFKSRQIQITEKPLNHLRKIRQIQRIILLLCGEKQCIIPPHEFLQDRRLPHAAAAIHDEKFKFLRML